MNLIYITGVTSTGKTTAGVKLSKYLKCPLLSVDHIYNIVAREIKHEHPEQLVFPERWQKIKNYKQLKEDAFKRLCKKEIPEGYDGDIVLEGFTLFFKEERDLVEHILCPKWITMFKLDISFEKWIEYRNKKYGKDATWSSWKQLNALFEKPKHYYSIKDISKLKVHYLEYQKKGFTDVKWNALKLSKDYNPPHNDPIYGKKILDLGCNEGWIGKYCLSAGAKSVIGIDHNWRYLEKARQKGIEVALDSVEDYVRDSPYKFDVVICLATLHYVWNKEKFIKDISRITNEMFVVEVPIFPEVDAEMYPSIASAFNLVCGKKHEVLIPSKNMMLLWLKRYFKRVEIVGESPAPDDSTRLVFKAYK